MLAQYDFGKLPAWFTLSLLLKKDNLLQIKVKTMKLLIEKWPFLSLHVSRRFLGKRTQQGFHLTNGLSPQVAEKPPFACIIPSWFCPGSL